MGTLGHACIHAWGVLAKAEDEFLTKLNDLRRLLGNHGFQE